MRLQELHFQDNKVKSPANPFLSETSKANDKHKTWEKKKSLEIVLRTHSKWKQKLFKDKVSFYFSE